MQAKMESGSTELMAEGCHGMWELSVSRENHADIRIDRMAALLKMLESPNVQVRHAWTDSAVGVVAVREGVGRVSSWKQGGTWNGLIAVRGRSMEWVDSCEREEHGMG